MPVLPSRPRSARGGLLMAALAVFISEARGSSPEPAPPRLAVVDRAIAQDRGHWQVDYRLRLEAPEGLVVAPAEVSARVEGWVSNSRVEAHAIPRASSLALDGASGLKAEAALAESAAPLGCCRERATLRLWADDGEAPPPTPAELRLEPGAVVRARLRLEHDHPLYGDFDPLLGRRDVELHLGPAVLHDTLPLDRELRVTQGHERRPAEDRDQDRDAPAPHGWAEPPEEWRDARVCISPPDCLHLQAHIAGHWRYEFPESPVRYATRMRLRFWYLIAPGTEGECRIRLTQARSAPYRSLPDGTIDEALPTVGRWVLVEKVFRTEPEATVASLDVRIAGSADVGELWLDDVSLEPLDAPPAAP